MSVVNSLHFTSHLHRTLYESTHQMSHLFKHNQKTPAAAVQSQGQFVKQTTAQTVQTPNAQAKKVTDSALKTQVKAVATAQSATQQTLAVVKKSAKSANVNVSAEQNFSGKIYPSLSISIHLLPLIYMQTQNHPIASTCDTVRAREQTDATSTVVNMNSQDIEPLSPFFRISTQELERLNEAGAQWEETLLNSSELEAEKTAEDASVQELAAEGAAEASTQENQEESAMNVDAGATTTKDEKAVSVSTTKKNLSLKLMKKKALPTIQEEGEQDATTSELAKRVDKLTSKNSTSAAGKVTKASVAAINAFSNRVGKYAYVRQGGSNGRGRLSCSVRLRSRVSPSVILNTLVLAACDSKALAQSTRWVEMGNNSAARLVQCVEIRQCTTAAQAKCKTTSTYLPVDKFDEMHREVVALNQQFRNWEDTDNESEMVVVNGEAEAEIETLAESEAAFVNSDVETDSDDDSSTDE